QPRVDAGSWPTIRATLATADWADEPPDDLADVWPEVRAAVAAGDLVGAARRLGGRGAGLTPTGDDVLAGILVADAHRDPGAEPLDTRRAAVAAADTGELSRAFLRWAAQGQSIEPVHR